MLKWLHDINHCKTHAITVAILLFLKIPKLYLKDQCEGFSSQQLRCRSQKNEYPTPYTSPKQAGEPKAAAKLLKNYSQYLVCPLWDTVKLWRYNKVRSIEEDLLPL